MTIRVNVDGKVESAEARLLSPLDQGFLFGASVYETIRTYNTVPFLLERHLIRLRESALALGINFEVSDSELATRVQDTLVAADNTESSVRIVVSAGVGAIDYRVGSTAEPTVAIVVRPLPEFPKSLYQEGAVASFVSNKRASPGNLNPKIKSSNLLNNLMALRAAHARNAYEALMLNAKEEVCEGSMTNVFTVEKAIIRTPPLSAGILEGITRELVIEIARMHGYELIEETILPRELLASDEVFITASSREIVPIVQVDDDTIANGLPGPITRKLMSFYKQEVDKIIQNTESNFLKIQKEKL